MRKVFESTVSPRARVSSPTDTADRIRPSVMHVIYSLEHGRAEFLHQHVVDAWAAQHADETTKPIGLTFALVGLYLHLEEGYSGRMVQRAHMDLGKRRRRWPSFPLPSERGTVTVTQVIAAPAGPERDRAIDAWCASVWAAYSHCHRPVAELLGEHGIGRLASD